MKKLLAMTLTLASLTFTGWGESEALASTTVRANKTHSAAPQWRDSQWRYRNWRRNNRNNRSRVRVFRTSRIVRYGFRTYRETYLVRYLPNGRTQTTLISRERIS